MHARDAIRAGESPTRLFLLDAWQESPHYAPRERAALAWTEALTLIATSHTPDSAYEELPTHFNDREIVQLSLLIATINTRSRVFL